VALAATAGVLLTSVGRVNELDLFWHIRVGQYTLHGQGFPHPDPFAYTLPDTRWHSTAWLSELMLAATYDALGFAGIRALRILLVLVLVLALSRMLVRRSDAWTGPVVFAITAVPLTAIVQDRPQLASLIFLAWLSSLTAKYFDSGSVPRRLRFVLMTYLWATIHGLFILGPLTLLLLAATSAGSQDRRRRAAARELAGTALVSLLACAATPMGPRLVLAPFTVGSAARGFISEWAPTSIWVFGAFGFYLLLAMLLLCAARSPLPKPRGEIAYVAAWAIFGLLAIRNAAPASIMLAPLAVRWADACWRTRSELRIPERAFRSTSALVLTASLLTVVGSPLMVSKPDRIAAYLNHVPRGTHVLNDYNLSGYLILRAPQIRVVVDGRADRYGSAFLSRYTEGVTGGPHWRSWVEQLNPDLAVLAESSPLPELLRVELGWTTVMTDDHFVLLRKPTLANG
jgi:hypothetical protein